MTVFCFLWAPLFYLFWRSLNGGSALTGGTWALFIGAVVAFFRFFLGSFVNPGGFGFSRWVSACIDVVALPAALPYLVCLVFVFFKIISPQANLTNYAFLWLIPVAAVRALGWSSQNDPILLMGAPVLWTTVVAGMGWFIQMIPGGSRWTAGSAILGTVALPLLAATAYWALFAQYTVLGLVLLFLCAVPAGFSLTVSFLESRR
ncbi:MAG: hypothetical protein LBG84_07685 [Treponema sp.]|jgi:hypothetical protein|nr:hypothetical protein [Treponema sp.]